VVVIRYGANAREVIAAVKKKIGEIQPGLPSGVRIVPFYDRSTLIDHAVDTLRHALIEELILVTLAHVLFSVAFPQHPGGHHSAPSRGFGRIPVHERRRHLIEHHVAGRNRIAIGVLVDAGIVMTENVIRQAEQYEEEHGNYRDHIWEITLNAARLVAGQFLLPWSSSSLPSFRFSRSPAWKARCFIRWPSPRPSLWCVPPYWPLR